MKPEDATHYCGSTDPIWYKYDLQKGMWMYWEGPKWNFAGFLQPLWVKEIK